MLSREKEAWITHSSVSDEYDICMDPAAMTASIQCLSNGAFAINSEYQICRTPRQFKELKFFHYFLQSSGYRFEFGFRTTDVYQACVFITETDDYPAEEVMVLYEAKDGEKEVIALNNHEAASQLTRMVTSEMFARLKTVVGWKRYSLCLSNSEHVVNYVTLGNWFSRQLLPSSSTSAVKSSLLPAFESHLKIDANATRCLDSMPLYISTRSMLPFASPQYLCLQHIKNRHSTPEELRADQALTDTFRDLTEDEIPRLLSNSCLMNYVELVPYLDESVTDTFNVLVVGKTGCGKSNMINAIVNKLVLRSKDSIRSVTKDITIVKGTAPVLNVSRNAFRERSVCLVDTIGLMDTELSHEVVMGIIRRRVQSGVRYVDCALICIEMNHPTYTELAPKISELCTWLRMSENQDRIVFVIVAKKYYTQERMDEELDALRLYMKIPVGARVIFVNFPDERIILLDAMQRKMMLDSFERIRDAVFRDPSTNRITINRTCYQVIAESFTGNRVTR